MHGHISRAGGDYHQNTQQSYYGDGGLLLVQGLLFGLGKLRDIAGIRDHPAPDKGEIQGAQNTHANAEGGNAEEAEGGDAQIAHHTVGGGVGAHTHQGDKAAELGAEQQSQQGLGGTDPGGDTHSGDQGGHGSHHADVAAHGAEDTRHNQRCKDDISLTFSRDTDHFLTDQISNTGMEQGGADDHHAGQQDDGVIAGEDVAHIDQTCIGKGDRSADGGDDDGNGLPDKQDDGARQNDQRNGNGTHFSSPFFVNFPISARFPVRTERTGNRLRS